MKNLILAGILIIIAFISSAQKIDTAYAIKPSRITAGDELIKATKIYYNGLLVSTIGVALVAVGTLTNDKNNKYDFNPQTALAALGGALMITGSIINLTAFIHVRKAGEKLNLKTGRDGLTLSYKF